ncbi:MAG: hypothetical protein ABS75_24925 [Pelagibacterium sp. SCN 63-23]|nr:MAG: hypothetical protein ABS75_24925 [Pelagibacterium sp. SCN 63-23]
MHHFEGFTQAKNPDLPESNEDRIVAIPGRLYAVIDGATDLSGLRYDDRLGHGATGGHLAAQAVAEALAIAGAGAFGDLPDPAALIAALNEAIAATYRRIGIAEAEIASGRERFRAAFVAAFVAGDNMRLVALGDCSIRVNGRAVLEHHFPGDSVLSKARAAAWSALAAKGLDAATIRPVARQFIVQGPASGAELPEPLDAHDLAAILAEVRADPAVLAQCDNDVARVDFLLAAGLEGIRADPGGFSAMVLDGVSDARSSVRVFDLALEEVETLELSSDGYPAAPETVSIAAWEAVLAEADRVDPERIGAYASTKGRVGKNFGDDRSILIISAGKFR